jgi:hypothetical protein
MSKPVYEEKRAETSFEVRPLFRAYDRRELGLPNRAISRFESIRLVDALPKSKSRATQIERPCSHNPFCIRTLSKWGPASAVAIV